MTALTLAYETTRALVLHANPLHVAFTLPALVVVACLWRTARETWRTLSR